MASPREIVIVAAVIIGGLCLIQINSFVGGGGGGGSPDYVQHIDEKSHSRPTLKLTEVQELVHTEKPLVLEGEDNPSAELKNLRAKGISYGLANHDIGKMSTEEIRLSLHSTLDQTTTICHRKIRMGVIGDGGWEICDDEDVRPRHPCVIYSFGIAGDWSFDDETAKIYNCHIYSFDPSIKQNTYNRSSHVHFYKIGLGTRTMTTNKGWKLYTFSDIRKLLGHDNTRIDVVKMDIEHAEWEAVKQMFQSGEKHFKQFYLEYHVGYTNAERLRLVQSMELAGYKVFYVHKNTYCHKKIKDFPGSTSICYEVHYVLRPDKK